MNAATTGNSGEFNLNRGNKNHIQLLEWLHKKTHRGQHERHPNLHGGPNESNPTLAAVAAAVVSAATLLPSRADAMGVGTAAAIDNAVSSMSGVEDVAYVCRWRYGYRRCFWVAPRRYYYRP